MTALAIRDDQTQFDEYQIAVLRQGGVDDDVSNAELAAFLHTCQRRQLDPFAGQIYLIGRWDKRKKRKTYKPQVSIDGFRLIARRAADRSSIDYAYEDTIWYDAKGTRHEVWLSGDAPAAAKVVVVRNGNRYDAVARYGAYVQVDKEGNPSGQWQSMADVMIAKCAESLALRKAFPEDLGGLYTAEEMAQADNPHHVTATAEVVRDEPRKPPVAYDEGWIDEALVKAVSFTTDDDGRALWTETVSMRKDGKIGADHDKQIKDLIKARWAELSKPQPLDPDDPWAAKVDEISNADEAAAAIAEVQLAAEALEIEDGRANRIRAAILAKAEQVAA